ncbi:MAG: hypothetical protein QM791_05530 [Ferruginibacter sp.]
MKQLILSLKEQIGDCKRKETSACKLKSPFEIVSSKIFFVFDDIRDEKEQPAQIVNSGDYQLTVRNSDQKDICFIKTDKCLLTDDNKKCDCILFSEDQFFMIEISESRAKNAKRRDAIQQLGNTIEILRANKIDLKKYQTTAVICFKSGKNYPAEASLNTKRELFRSKYNVLLEEGNNIEFI